MDRIDQFWTKKGAGDIMLQVDYQEGRELMERCQCAQCGGELSLAWGGAFGIDGFVLRCGHDAEHAGIRSREDLRHQERRQPADATQASSLLKSHPVDTLKALVRARFPRAELDDVSATLFIMDCLRLDLDPLMGEIVPVTFSDGHSRRPVVTPVLTEDGWLALAARACPDMWLGPPATEPVTGDAFKEALLGEGGKDAWVWKATGRMRRAGESVEITAYGWLKRKEWEQTHQDGTPAREFPGNQARVRAVKRWVRESFPEARARMKQMTGLWLARAQEVEEARRVIDAEYRAASPPQDEKAKPPRDPVGDPDPEATEPAVPPPPFPECGWSAFTMERVERLRREIGDLLCSGPCPSRDQVEEWWDRQGWGYSLSVGDFLEPAQLDPRVRPQHLEAFRYGLLLYQRELQRRHGVGWCRG